MQRFIAVKCGFSGLYRVMVDAGFWSMDIAVTEVQHGCEALKQFRVELGVHSDSEWMQMFMVVEGKH